MAAALALAVSLVLGTAAASWAAVGLTRRALVKRAILDHPNPRSSHSAPVPRGGGIGVLAVLLPVWLALSLAGGGPAWLVPAAALGLAILSWHDDLAGLAPLPRLLLHAAAVGVGLLALSGPIAGGLLPLWLDRAVAALAWLWFVNLFNFMDGIDGIAGTQAAAMGLGAAAVVAVAGGVPTAFLALATAGAAAGFLVWNWQPARIFLGDVGSVPLGYLLGFLCLSLAAQGLWLPALVLPAYYLADATVTLLARIVRGARPWQAHREHFYQRAVAGGRSHGRVAGAVLVADLLLVVTALAHTAGWLPAWLALPAAGAIVLALLAWMNAAGRGARGQASRSAGLGTTGAP